MPLPSDYAERVYAGVLGKLIGVYLGRPFEGWPYEMIMEQLGEIDYYVHDLLDVPLVVTDDDISGTFTFVRAMEDYHFRHDLSAREIGHTWLNYIIERRTILSWAGLGNSTEHTAYLRLKNGIDAPASGSMALNGQVVAEQIGSQIFIDGWALISPGNPERAARLAAEASRVSHDGEAVHGAVMVAAMEAQAFVESDLNQLLDTGLSFIPRDSLIHRMIDELREWHAVEPDWKVARGKIAAKYGYDSYGGNCHMVPNHALIILALLYGNDDFQRALRIVNTCGWDTDCNSGNVGCLMGIKNGLQGIDGSGPDWRGPIADRLYMPTADGGRAVTDAVTESVRLATVGAKLAGAEPPAYKNGARFHFSFPGSVQGFEEDPHRDTRGVVTVRNIEGHSTSGARSLALRFRGMAPAKHARIETQTFIPDRETLEYSARRGYGLLSAPTLYPGQTIQARLEACPHNPHPIMGNLFLKVFGKEDKLDLLRGDSVTLAPGSDHVFAWKVPDTGGNPIAKVGVELRAAQSMNGYAFLDYLTWEGMPNFLMRTPDVFEFRRDFGQSGMMWRHAWVNGVDHHQKGWSGSESFRLIHNQGRGLLMTGTREWRDYQVTADVTPHLVEAAGLGVNVQGMKRYIAFLLCRDDRMRLLRCFDGEEEVLAEAPHPLVLGQRYEMSIVNARNSLRCLLDGQEVLTADNHHPNLTQGGIALLVEEGRTGTSAVRVQPA